MTTSYTINDIINGEALVPESIGLAAIKLANASRKEQAGEVIDWMTSNAESLLSSDYGSIGELQSITGDRKNTVVVLRFPSIIIKLKSVVDLKSNVLYAYEYIWKGTDGHNHSETVEMTNEIMNLIPHGNQVAGKYQLDFNDIMQTLKTAFAIRHPQVGESMPDEDVIKPDETPTSVSIVIK